MKRLLEKLQRMEQAVSLEKGPFDLFALILPRSSVGGWDLMVAASWIKSQKEGLDFFTDLLRRCLTEEEILRMSRIIILHQDSATLKRIRQEFGAMGDVREMKDTSFFGLPVKRAYIIAGPRTPLALTAR